MAFINGDASICKYAWVLMSRVGVYLGANETEVQNLLQRAICRALTLNTVFRISA